MPTPVTKQDERDRERVGEEAHLHLETAGRQPREEVHDVLARARREVEQREEHDDRPRGTRGRADALAIQPASGSPMRLPNSSRNDGAEQRQRGDEPDQIEEVARAHRQVSPSAVRTSSAVAPRRRRKIATMMREADGDLGRGDHQGEEHEAPGRATSLSWRANDDEREVHRVEHQLDAHEHHEHVAADEHARPRRW